MNVNSKSRRRRALVVEPAGNLWGSERVLLDFLQIASRQTWDLAVCCPPRTPILPQLERLPVRVFPFFRADLQHQGRFARAAAFVGLLLAALRFRPDLIYVNQAGATRHALLAGGLLRVPVVTHVRLSGEVQYIESIGAPSKRLPKVICISEYIRELFTADGPIGEQQLAVMYDVYTPKGDWNRPPSIPPRLPLFTCVGRLESRKGQDILLDALATLKSRGIPANAVFLGAPSPGDSFGDVLKEKQKTLGLSESVTWVGFTERVLPEVEKATALVLPSHTEPLGRVLFEAWDAGTVPVVFAGSGGAAEVVERASGGLLYDRQDGASLATALESAIQLTPEERRELVENGRRWMQENCDPAGYTERMIGLWNSLV